MTITILNLIKNDDGTINGNTMVKIVTDSSVQDITLDGINGNVDYFVSQKSVIADSMTENDKQLAYWQEVLALTNAQETPVGAPAMTTSADTVVIDNGTTSATAPEAPAAAPAPAPTNDTAVV